MKQDNEEGNRERWKGDKQESFALFQEAGLQEFGPGVAKADFSGETNFD